MAKKTLTAAQTEPVPTDPTAKSTYVVTKNAPSRVAGRRVAASDKLALTEYEARAELQQLHIVPADQEGGVVEPASTEV